MNYELADKVAVLPPSGIRKVNEKAMAMERRGDKIIHLEIGRPDFDTPQYIKEACKESLDAGHVFYTSNFGMMALREQIAEKFKYQNHITYEAQSEVLVTIGVSEAVYAALAVLLNSGDEVLVPDPVWINYMNMPRYLGATPITYNLLEKNEYQLDLKEIEGKITSKTKAIVLISPNNPTGSVLQKEVLEALADMVKKHNLYVISDEVYERIIFDEEKHISIASLEGMKERTITLNGFSKAYSMTGWRIGYVGAPQPLITAMNKVHQHLTICTPSFVQEAAVVALRDERTEITQHVKEYQRRRDYLVKAINEIEGISMKTPKGAFYGFVNIKKLKIPAQEFATYLLEEGKVATVPGDVFGSQGEGYIRVSFANSYENIVTACDRIKACVEKLQEGAAHEV